MSAGRRWRRPRRRNWSSTMRSVPSSQPESRGTSAAWASRINGRQNDGPAKAASTRGSSASIAARCSSLCRSFAMRRSSVAQVPLAEVELGLGEGGTDGAVETVVVVADDALRSALQGAKERLPVGLGRVGEGLDAPELRPPGLKARRAEDLNAIRKRPL